MKKTTSIKVATALGAGAMLVVAAPIAANAHVTVAPSSTETSSYSVLTFAVGHGCEGSPTNALTFSIPDSVKSVTPTVNPGWDISQDEGVITYSAAEPLPDGQRTTFELSIKLPDEAVGDQLDFPVLQQCEVGATDWSEVATGGETEPQHPAPFIVLTEPSGDAVGHSHSAADSATVATTASTAAASNSDDIVARILGIGGLILGTVGVIVGLQSRRKEASK